MSSLTYFYQACPICGRSLRVPVQYFGRPMSCSHCGGEFHADGDDARLSRSPKLMTPAATNDQPCPGLAASGHD